LKEPIVTQSGISFPLFVRAVLAGTFPLSVVQVSGDSTDPFDYAQIDSTAADLATLKDFQFCYFNRIATKVNGHKSDKDQVSSNSGKEMEIIADLPSEKILNPYDQLDLVFEVKDATAYECFFNDQLYPIKLTVGKITKAVDLSDTGRWRCRATIDGKNWRDLTVCAVRVKIAEQDDDSSEGGLKACPSETELRPSPKEGGPLALTIHNKSPLSLQIMTVDPEGTHQPCTVVKANQFLPIPDFRQGRPLRALAGTSLMAEFPNDRAEEKVVWTIENCDISRDA
jgi:hypothetical protein